MSAHVFHGDCLEIMPRIPNQSIDMILCDLPYGTTACKWDVIIPFEPLWEQYKRIIKPRGAIVLTASQPFTSKLVMSNLKWFHQELIWNKQHPKGFLDARRKHLDDHETILIFSNGLPAYNPQGLIPVCVKNGRNNKAGNGAYSNSKVGNPNYIQTEGNFPRSVLHFNAITNGNVHPTQKPVSLYSYLIRTYTQPGDVVLDFCCGSGTTAVAAQQESRRFIAGDQSAEYVAIARKRLAQPYTLNFMTMLEAQGVG